MHPKIGEVLCKCLDPVVGERYSTVLEVLERGLGATVARSNADKQIMVLSDVTTAVGGDLLPPAALEKAAEHSGAIVDATLSSVTELLVQCGDVQGALNSCAEWMGVAPPGARPGVISVYCKLWKVFGGEMRMFTLSKAARSHWGEDMLSGDGVMQSLATSLSFSAAPCLEEIDLSEQRQLEGDVLGILLAACVLPKLRTINFSGCRKATCVIPASITRCGNLAMLDLGQCGREGRLHYVVVQYVSFSS